MQNQARFNSNILSFSKAIKPGLKENLFQFSVLVIINAFVGGMIGLERSIIPQIAEAEFHIAAKTALFSFIIVFGSVKAFTNYFTGKWSAKFGKKNLLVFGWLFALPVPFILMYADHWNWIIFANVLLGIQQGITWSTTVVMKIDIAGEKDRGFAMGINEFAGYLSLALVAFLTGYIAQKYGLRPYPFYIGVVLSVAGLLSSLLFVKDTQHFVTLDSSVSKLERSSNIFSETTWKNHNLSAVTQAGLINNLNDAMSWGLLPILLLQKNFSLTETGSIIAIYPAVWGLTQIFTGKLSDIVCKKSLLFWGMLIQAVGLFLMIIASQYSQFIAISSLLGLGTALVYPTFMASIADNTHPADRAESIGVFRLWRDLGYAIGAILTGILVDQFNISTAIAGVAGLTLLSSFIIQFRMGCSTHHPKFLDVLKPIKFNYTKQ